jgi:hypothetical protein
MKKPEKSEKKMEKEGLTPLVNRVVQKMKFLNKFRWKTALSRPSNQRFVGGKLQDLFDTQPGY